MANEKQESAFDPQELRQRALERLRKRHGKVADLPVGDVETLVHELEVYQVELEVQNEELRRAQLELAAALERYRDLYNHAPVGYLTLDADGNILQANHAAAQLCFRDRYELAGRRLDEIAHHIDSDKLYLLLRSSAATGLPQATDFRIERPVGAPHWAHANISRLPPSQEAPAGFRLTLTDITARKQAEEELRESEERFHTLANNISQLVWMANTNGERFWYNQQWLDYTGMTFKEARDWGWTKVHHPDHVDRVVNSFQWAVETGEQWEETFPLRSKTGEYRWFLTRALPIRDAEGNIVRWFGTNTDVTEIKRLQDEEHRLREAAEEATRVKDEFLALVSHELRTPLVPILGYLRLMRANPHDAEAVARNCEIIERSARAQKQLIEDLLDTTRVISGKLKLELAQTDVRLVLEDAIEVVRQTAEAKQIDLRAQLDEAPQKMLCDAMRIRQVVWNLLQNAIKFTPAGGRVELRAERDDGRVRLIVSDTGRGIKPDFLPAIFDRFSQVDKASKRRQGGLGLGLSLAKYLVEMHGGAIEAASAGAGQGATFTVTLPISAPQAASDIPAIAEISSRPGAIPLEDLPRLDGLRVLVVDDQEEARTIIAATLGEFGAAVTVAASGHEALELVEEPAFDALVCDIAMPEMDGYELIGRLRAMEKARGQRLPAIAMAALARPEDRLQALRAGFQMHVAKPVELAELVAVIDSIVQLRKLEQP